MKRSRGPKTLALAALVALGATACNDDDGNGPIDPPPNGGAAIDTLSGSIAGDVTLSPDTQYVLVGYVQVPAGASLTVPAGTELLSDPNTQGTLVTLRCEGDQPSGRLLIQGTETDPVRFRPVRESGRTRGLAGGIVLHGCAPINVPGGTALSEGVIALPYGGGDDEDSSGSIRYLTIEFGGIPVTPDNEINGLTMAGVGRGTTVEFVQAHFIADDGFEWFGGTVHGNNLLSSGNDDDAFDCDFGWNGTVQFAVAIQDRNLANRGEECDNDADGSQNQPLTSPSFWNLTSIGAGVAVANDDVNDGLYIRRNAGGQRRNAIVANFGNVGAVIDGQASWERVQEGTLVLDNILFFNNRGLESGEVAADSLTANVQRKLDDYTAEGVAEAFAGGTFVFADPQLTSVNYEDPIDGTAPDLRPQAGSPALDAANAAVPTDEGIVDAGAQYLGAFGDDDWTAGWTVWETD